MAQDYMNNIRKSPKNSPRYQTSGNVTIDTNQSSIYERLYKERIKREEKAEKSKVLYNNHKDLEFKKLPFRPNANKRSASPR